MGNALAGRRHTHHHHRKGVQADAGWDIVLQPLHPLAIQASCRVLPRDTHQEGRAKADAGCDIVLQPLYPPSFAK
eukprot:1160479-Pelagomonas_calceolata.AAC.12